MHPVGTCGLKESQPVPILLLGNDMAERERHGYIERRERTGKIEEKAHTRTPARVKRPGQPHQAEEQLLLTTQKETTETADEQGGN
jgi:hypothetical protein